MAEETHVPVTREGAVGALKLLMIVLSAVILWNSASALNEALQERGLVTAPPYTHGLVTLLFGMETTAPFVQRVSGFWNSSHHLIALAALLTAVVFLTTRYLILGRVLDFLYLESEHRNKRIYSGFIANIFLVLIHAGIIYGLATVGRTREHAGLVPLTMMALLLFNSLWALGLFLSARRQERHSLRGLQYVAITSAVGFFVLAGATWALEGVAPKDVHLRASQLTILAVGAALLVCLVDAIIQTRIYCRRTRAAA